MPRSKTPELEKERRKKISATLKGRMPKNCIAGWNKGKSALWLSERNRKNIGRIPWNKGRIGYSTSLKGKKRPNMTGENHPLFGKKRPEFSGENSPVWVKDRTKLKKSGDTNKDRRSSAYVIWRTSVYRRDGFKCRIDNQNCSGRIEAHHILGFTEHIELRYEINNGITLCHFHHPRKRDEEVKLSPFFQEMVTEKN